MALLAAIEGVVERGENIARGLLRQGEFPRRPSQAQIVYVTRARNYDVSRASMLHAGVFFIASGPWPKAKSTIGVRSRNDQAPMTKCAAASPIGHWCLDIGTSVSVH